MRTLIIFTFLITIFSQKLNAQNLVPNPSFEDTVNCNGPWNCNCSLEIASPWFNPNDATSDLFTDFVSCGYTISQAQQIPRTGNAFAGLYGQLVNTREYLQVELSDTLQNNHVYCVGFYISRSESCGGAIDRMGIYFSNDSMILLSPYNFTVIPHLESQPGVLLTDTSNWYLISGLYTASGGEKFLTIGNFRDTSQTLWQVVDSSITWCSHAYYYIDDVYIYVCDSITSISQSNIHSNAISIHYYPDYILFDSNLILTGNKIFEVYNSSGLLITKNSSFSSEMKYVLNQENLSNGVYVLRIQLENIEVIKRFLILK